MNTTAPATASDETTAASEGGGAADAQRELLTPRQAAALLQMSLSTVYNHLRSGELPGHKIGHQWRVPRRELVEAPASGDVEVPA
jgi:excisionase family DNA binding protein